ncbi:MAG: malto-oligosyltrehalose trehalohydrolase [Planctomycetes bacterium]|nr:malto-oligosyltrehalose trehalohydrolase [Planctomycetota bacterium]
MSDLFPSPSDLPQGVFQTSDGGAQWRVWAPYADALSLVIWRDADECVMPMKNSGDGYFMQRASDVGVGLRYAYRFPSGNTRPDPATRWQPDGIHAPSAVFFPEPEGTDGRWAGVSLRDLVIYELHVGTFTSEGTFDAIVPRLDDLVSLGVTAIELMPIAQFPGSRNWGYDGVHPYAVQNSYGGPQGLMRFVKSAHEAGLGVIVDVVYNHFGPEGNYIGEFGPYYSDCHHTPWGNAINFDGPDSGPVRRFVIDNAVSWVRDFGVDGLRLDAVQTIYDLSAKHLLAELAEEVRTVADKQNRHVHVIGETNQNDSRLVQTAERGGYGLDGIWADDLHHSIHASLTGERDGYYVDFGQPEHIAKAFNDAFVYDGRYSRYRRSRHGNNVDAIGREKFVVCIQNHDQVGNRPMGDRLSTNLSDEQLRLAAALMLISPFTPLLFMGEEYGETAPFPFFCSFLDEALGSAVRRGRRAGILASGFRIAGRLPDPCSRQTFDSATLSWQWQNASSRLRLRLLYQRLLAARKEWPVLRDRLRPTATVIESTDESVERSGIARILELTYERCPEYRVIANVCASSFVIPQKFSEQRVLFTTMDAPADKSSLGLDELHPYELKVFGPQSWVELRE